MNASISVNERLMRRATVFAVAVSGLLILIKFAAYLLTGSVAMLSSLIDSALDLLASGVNLLAVHIALQPPDHEHRFGHGKAEPLAGLAQAAFISGSALFLLFEVVNRLLHPQPVAHVPTGVVVMLISIGVTVALVWYQRRVIARTGSVAISADSLHYRGDVLVNLGVIAALVLDRWLGWRLADPLIAGAIAAYILYSAWRIARQSLDQLMDRELPDAERQHIEALARAHPQVRGVHELRTRSSGLDLFIQLHLVLDPMLDLRTAHAIAADVQRELQSAYPQADIIIHQDPAGDPDCAPADGGR